MVHAGEYSEPALDTGRSDDNFRIADDLFRTNPSRDGMIAHEAGGHFCQQERTEPWRLIYCGGNGQTLVVWATISQV
jgi:hypothetical protein